MHRAPAPQMRKLERGEQALVKEPFSIRAAVRSVLQACRMGAQGDTSRLCWVNEGAAAQLPEHAEGDVAKIAQIIHNLVNNAMKHCEGAPVTVEVLLEAHAAPEAESGAAGQAPPLPLLRVVVADRGPGLSPEQCERIFEPYTRGTLLVRGTQCCCCDARAALSHVLCAALHLQHRGTGIGLRLSREFARAMGGDVTVQSTPGVGSMCAFA